MIYDFEDNHISLNASNVNQNILVTGTSGSGKSYFAMNKCLEEVDKKHKVCIIDYSDSYSKEQFENNNISMEDIEIIKPRIWYLNFKTTNEFVYEVTDALVETLKITSYRQKSILRQFCSRCYRKFEYINIRELISMIEEFIDNKEYSSKDELKMVELLYQKLSLYNEVDIQFSNRKKVNYEDSMIHVISLSDYSIKNRSMLSKLYLEFIWRETKKGHRSYDFLVMDEFQYLKVEGDILEFMLRESRKYGLRIMLLTQMLYNFKGNDVNLLMQVGTRLIFKATAKEARLMAREISDDNSMVWERILKNLERGEVIIHGNYLVNNSLEGNTPIICKVRSFKKG